MSVNLSATVDRRGYSSEFGATACLTRVTIAYTGDAPGGVSAWSVCAQNDPFGESDELPVAIAAWLGCDPLDTSQVPTSDDETTPLQVVSESTTELVLDCWIRYPEQNTAQGGDDWDSSVMGDGFLWVEATTAAGAEQSSFIVECDAASSWSDHDRVAYTETLGCPAYWWKVLSVENAGPFEADGTPSSSGKMVTIAFTPLRAVDENLENQVGLGEDCYQWPTEIPEGWAAGYEAGDGAFEDASPKLYPPRGAKWEAAAATPLVRLRYPPMAGAGYDAAAAAADPDYSDKHPDTYKVVEIFLGECSEELTETPTVDWDFSVDGTETNDYQTRALLSYGVHEFGEPGFGQDVWDYPPLRSEVDLTISTTAGAESNDLERRVAGVRLKVTETACHHCCECSPRPPTEMQTPAVHYRYAGPGPDHVCTIYRPAVYFGGPTPVTPARTETRTYKTWRYVRDDSYLIDKELRCGALIGWDPGALGGRENDHGNAFEVWGVHYDERPVAGWSVFSCDVSGTDTRDQDDCTAATYDASAECFEYSPGDGYWSGDPSYETGPLADCVVPDSTSEQLVEYHPSRGFDERCPCNDWAVPPGGHAALGDRRLQAPCDELEAVLVEWQAPTAMEPDKVVRRYYPESWLDIPDELHFWSGGYHYESTDPAIDDESETVSPPGELDPDYVLSYSGISACGYCDQPAGIPWPEE